MLISNSNSNSVLDSDLRISAPSVPSMVPATSAHTSDAFASTSGRERGPLSRIRSCLSTLLSCGDRHVLHQVEASAVQPTHSIIGRNKAAEVHVVSQADQNPSDFKKYIIIGERHDVAGGLFELKQLCERYPDRDIHLEIDSPDNLERLWSIGDDELEQAKRCSILLNLPQDKIKTHDLHHAHHRYWTNPFEREAGIVRGMLQDREKPATLLIGYLHIPSIVSLLNRRGVATEAISVRLPDGVDTSIFYPPLPDSIVQRYHYQPALDHDG